jgi:chromosome segregation ATPase
VARARVLEFRRTLMPRDLGHLRRNRERVIAEIERRQAEIEALQARLAEIDMTIEGSATEINAPATD